MRLSIQVWVGVGVALIGGTALAELSKGVVYRNDFATRESAGAIPELGVWHEAQPYPSTTKQITSYASPETYKEYHGYGFDVYGKHRWLYFHDLFHEELSGSSGHATFDGWFHPNWRTGTASSETSGYSALWQHRFGINAGGLDADGKVNPSAWFYYDTATERQGYVLHPWHNSFTNGQLKIQVDMRAPLQWAITSPRHIMLFPVYDKYMRMEAWDGKNNTGEVSPGKFGFRCGGTAGRENRTYPMYYDSRKAKDGSTTQLGNNYSGDGESEKNCYWFRFEVTYDLETAKFSGSVKSLDKAWITGSVSNETKIAAFEALPRPTFATTTSSLKSKTFENGLWIGCATNSTGQLTTDLAQLWREKGGLSGFALFVGQLSSTGTLKLQKSGSSTAIHPLVDNIRVSWKAPSATDFAVCYENDFQTRRYRTLSASSAATTATYAAKTESVAVQDVFSGYPDGALNTYNILPKMTKEQRESAGEPGIDGWRRHAWGGANSIGGPVGVSSSSSTAVGSGGKVMAFAWNGSYTCLSQPIGTSLMSGKVTLQADVFLQGEWSEYTYVADCNRAMVVLGSTAMHTAGETAFPKAAAASFGYSKVRSGEKDAYVYDWTPITGPYGKATTLAGEAPEKNNWYRYQIVADLDQKSYDVTVWKMGANSQPMDTESPAETFFTQTGIAFENDVADIGSFAIYGYGYGNAIDKGALNHRVLVDNIIVKHNDETLYTNNFATRTRTIKAQPTATGYLAYEYNLPDGQDGWIRPDGVGDEHGWAAATVRDDNGNKFASLGALRETGTSTRYGHVFGQAYMKEGFSFSVDLRPPCAFKGKNGLASVALGGRSLEQLQAHEAIADANKMLEFGFKGTATDYADYVGEKGVPFVGDQLLTFTQPVDLSHWYRFTVDGKVSSNTCQLRVYDMGTMHPTVDTPKGSLVCSVANLVPEKDLSTGLSAFYLTAKQVGNTPGETGIDVRQMLVDNIELKKIEDSLCIFIR